MDPRAPITDLPILETERLVLRRTTVDDTSLYSEMRNRNLADPATSPFLIGGGHGTLDDARSKLSEVDRRFREENAALPWTVTRRGSDDLLGVVGFVRWDQKNRHSEIMYEMDPRHTGQGLVVEAMRPVIAFGFEVMGLHRVEAHIDPRNARSIRVAERLGLTFEGILRQNTLGMNGFLDSAVYARLAVSD